MKKLSLPWRMIAIGILVAIFFFFIMFAFTFRFLGDSSYYFWVMLIGWLPICVIIASAIILKTFVYDWCSVRVNANYGIVLANRVIKHEAPSNKDARTGMYPIGSLREIVGPATADKWPSEYVIKNGAINLETEIVVGNPEENQPAIVVYNKDGIGYEIRFQMMLRALVGFLTNLVRHTEEAAQAFFIGRAMQYLIYTIVFSSETEMFDLLKEEETEDGKKKPKLYKGFENLWGGPNKVHSDEERMGRITGNVSIVSIKRSERIQKAMEGGLISARFTAALAEAGKFCDSDIAAIILAEMMGLAENLNPLIVTGLKGIDPKTLTALRALAGKEVK